MNEEWPGQPADPNPWPGQPAPARTDDGWIDVPPAPTPSPAVESSIFSRMLSPVTDVPHEIYGAGKSAISTMADAFNPWAKAEEWRQRAKQPFSLLSDLSSGVTDVAKTGEGLLAAQELLIAPLTGAARSLIGHPYSLAGMTYEEAKQGVDLAMMGLAPGRGMVAPKPFVRPVPILPIEGSPNPGVPRSVAAQTGIPEVDAVINHPTIKEIIDNPVVDRSHTIPYEAGGSTPIDNPTTYLDKHVPQTFTARRLSDPSKTVTFDTSEPTVIHENVEEFVMDILIKGGMTPEEAYRSAHFGWAEEAEHAWYRAHDIDPASAEEQWKKVQPGIQHEIAADTPPDLYKKEYPGADVTKARHEQVFEADPTPEEMAHAREIVANAPELNRPSPQETLGAVRNLGVIGPDKPEPTFNDSPSDLAAKAVPRSLGADITPEEQRTILGHKPGEYDERGKEWISKIDEPEDVRNAIENIANEKDFFPEARGGLASVASRDAVAEAAGVHPSKIDESYFSTHFDNDGKVRAVIQALRQTANDFAEASKKARDEPTTENLAAAAEAELRHTHVLEYTLGFRAESGRSLAAWKDLLRETEHARATVAIRAKEGTGEAPVGTADLVGAANDVRNNLKDAAAPKPGKGAVPPQKPIGLQNLVDAAKKLADNADKPPPEGKPATPMAPEVKSLVDDAKNVLKKFGAQKDEELEAFRQQLDRLTAGNGKLDDVVESARALLKKNEKPKAETGVEAGEKVASTKGQLMGAAKRLVAAADDLKAAPKEVSPEMRATRETVRQAVGRLKEVNRTGEIEDFRAALSGAPQQAAAAAQRLIDAENKAKSAAQAKQPVEYDQIMAAARRVASAATEKVVGEKTELPPDVKALVEGASGAVKELQKERETELGRLVDAAEKQAVNMTKQKMTKEPAEALSPELQSLVDKAGRVVKRFGGIDRGEKAALLLGRTGRTFVEQEELVRSVAGLTPNQVAKVLSTLRTSAESGKPGWFYWLWQQGLISGLITHTKYLAVNTSTLFLERTVSPLVAAVIGKARGQQVSLGAPLYANVAMIKSLPDALSAAGQAFKTGLRVPLASEMRLFERGEESPQTKGATAAYTQSPSPEWGIWKRVFNEDQLDTAAKVLGIPGRSANMIHTFYKVLSERASASSLAFEAAAAEGATGDKFWQRYQYHIDNPTDDALRGAVNDAYTGAFMAKLGPKMTQFTQALSKNPVTKWLFPFQHIPWNIEGMTIKYSPFAVLGPEMRSAILGQKGAPAQNLAIAKMAVGSSILGYFIHKVLADEATSDYPTDEKERNRWKMLGIQPNSIQINGRWVGIERLGPAGNVAHIGSAIGSIIKHYDGQDDEALTSAIWAASMAAANQVGNEVGFQSLRNIIDALENKNKAERFTAWQAGSLVYPSSFLSQNASFIDPYQREANKIVNGLKYRIPFLRETLLPKRDPLYGEPVPNPSYHSITPTSVVSVDPVKQELDRLKYYPKAPEDRIGGVKLTPEQYDQYQATAGAIARTSLETVMQAPEWHATPSHMQEILVKNVVESSRQMAGLMMQSQNPTLLQQGIQQKLDYITGVSPTARPKKPPVVVPAP